MKSLPKHIEYRNLVLKRKSFTFSDPQLTNPSKTKFDIDEIEPYAQWQNNLNAKILLVGQEFCDLDTYIETEGKVERFVDQYEYPSNKNLNEYFKLIGFDIGHSCAPNYDNPIFFTNAVMGLKTPPMSANFKSVWLRESREHFLRPLIEIIKPSIIITVGTMATKSIAHMYNLKLSSHKEMVTKSPHRMDDIKIFPVYHPGGLGLRNRQKFQQIEDWKRIKNWL